MPKLPKFPAYLLRTTGLLLVFLTLLRFIYWLTFKDSNNPIALSELLNAFYIGLKFDIRLILFLLLPVALIGWLKYFHPVNNHYARLFWRIYLGIGFFIIMVFYYTDFGHYAYLHKPLDATVVRFFADFSISAKMMWQSYPIIWLLLSFVVLNTAFDILYTRFVLNKVLAAPPIKGWKRKTLVSILCVFLYLLGLYGKFSFYPLRWSDAFTSTHPFAPAVALNPVLYFYDTFKNKSTTFDENKTRQYYELIADYLGVTDKNPQTLNFKRAINKPGTYADRQPNIVMVFLESFASYKTGIFGNPLNPTPNFDRISQQGILFRRFYIPHTGTARSVFSIITGLPDIEQVKTSSRNPLIVDQHTIVNAFKGYEKFYFLGGSANWGNIRGVLSHNIPGLHIYEEGSYKSSRMDVWGISDVDLFKEAHQVLKKQTRPFFAIIQTSGNHRPYNIPKENFGFKLEEFPRKELKESGFQSNKEFNAFRFMDHSIGYFLKQARTSAYFNNTIFVFYGDHGITGYGGKHTPGYESSLPLTGLHVPLLIYAPGLIKVPRMLDTIASGVDVLPTIAGLAANGYTDTTLGRDLFDTRFDTQRYAFTFIRHIGVLGKRYYFRMYPDGGSKELFDTTQGATQNLIKQKPDIARQLENLTTGLYEATKYIRQHNKSGLKH